MNKGNQTSLTEFVIMGFEGHLVIKVLIPLVLCLLYIVSLGGNCLIIVLVSVNHRLHSAMYFFLLHLSVIDIIVTSNVVPNILHCSLQQIGVISYSGCLTQLFFFGMTADAESLLLMVMSYDRYLAICKPLRYNSIMDSKCQLVLVTCCWLVSFTIAFMVIYQILKLNFCGPNIINHFFCDLDPLLDLSCSDTFVVDIEILIAGIPVTVFAFVFIVVTYVCIFQSIYGSPIATGRQKAFSTCSSHLIVVCIYYGTLITNYIIPMSGQTIILTKYISLLYTVMTPLLNPIIYTLRNKEIRVAFNYFVLRSFHQF